MTTLRCAAGRLALTGGAAVALVALALPAVSGADWAGIGAALGRATPAGLALLGAVWLLGLWVHTPSLTAALPGLTHRQSLVLNLTGSAVSNLLPLGGAAGTVVNWRTARGWGFSSAAFARWAVLTNLADTGVKLVLPVGVLCWFAASGVDGSGRLLVPGLVGLGLLVVLGAFVRLLVRDDRALRRMGGRLDRLAARVPRIPSAAEGYGERAARFRCESADLVRRGWVGLVGGKLAYAVLQGLLLWLCLRVVGADVAAVVVASAFVVERLLSMLVVTPGATGFVEVGMAGALTAFGVVPAGAAAGVLLYRLFVVGMEVPVGGLLLAGWWVGQRRAERGGVVVPAHPGAVRARSGAHDAVRTPIGGAARWSTPVSAAPASPSAGSRSAA